MSELPLLLAREQQDVPGVPGLSLDYRLRWMDFDRYQRIKPSAILDLFQDVATLQADNQGIGYEDMIKKGVFWVVIRSKFEIVRQPERHSTVTVRTWPHSPSRFSFMRDFSMRDEEGNLLIKATSEWVFMGVESRKFVRITDAYDGTMTFDEHRAFSEKVRRVMDFDTQDAQPFVLKPNFVDIDDNGHVNNAIYADFVLNALQPTGEGSLKTFQIDYRQEVRPDESLQVFTHREDGFAMAKGVCADGAVAFLSKLEFA